VNRTAVITGALGGIGAATARLFHKHGWFVIGLDIHETSDTPEGIDLYMSIDVSDVKSWNTVIQKIECQIESVQCLVNNAAIQICKPLVEMAPDEWDRLMSVNLKSVYLSLRTMYPLFNSETEAAIVNVSSVHALATSTQIAAYAASKGGVLALTRAMALELSPQIRVNAVLPGAVDTPMLRAGLSRSHVEGKSIDDSVLALGRKHASGAVGQSQEIAEAIYFLADSKRSSFITGQALVVDGGATVRLSTE